jgi:hypothetical protein
MIRVSRVSILGATAALAAAAALLPVGCSDGSTNITSIPGVGSGASSSSSGGGADASVSGEPGGGDASAKGRPADAGAPGEGGAPAIDGALTDAGAAEDTGSPNTTFTLIDTNVHTIVDGEPVSGWDPIPENSTIDLAKVGLALSIRANTTPPVVGSVVFVLDGAYTHTEGSAPYTLCSDDGKGDIDPCPLTLGAHVLVATPYMTGDGGTDAGKVAMPSTTLYFTLVNSASDGGTDAALDGYPAD